MTTLHPSADAGDGRYVHALGLLRLTWLRREFRAVGAIAIAVFGLSTWLLLGLHAATSFGSSLWNLADEAWDISSLVLLGVLAICCAGALVIRFAGGRIGRIASAFAPIFKRCESVTVQGDQDALRGLLPRLTKRQPISIGVLVLFVGLIGLGVGPGLGFAPAYAGSHGHGGITVTIGRDAFPGRVEQVGKRTDYYIDTTVGEAFAEDGRPSGGERWVVRTDADDQVAYLIGGHDYVLLGALSVLGACGAIACAVVMFSSVRREHRRRKDAGHVPLTYAVRRLAAGARPTVVFQNGTATTIGLPALPHDTDSDAASLLRTRRRHTVLVVGTVVVVAGLSAGVIVEFGGGSGARQAVQPSSRRELTLPYLANTSWSVDAAADYTDSDHAIHDLTVDMLQQGGVPRTARVGAAWQVTFASKIGNSRQPADLTAEVDVSEIGPASPARAAAGGIAFDESMQVGTTGVPSPAPVHGLPAGWRGLAFSQASDTETSIVDLFGSAEGSLVEIGTEGPAHDPAVITRAVELASAIARHGIGNFVADTRR